MVTVVRTVREPRASSGPDVPTARYRVAHVTTVDLTLRFLVLEQMRRLRDEGFEVTGISAPGPWGETLREEGIAFVPWTNATRSWSPVADVRAFLELFRLFRRGRYDIVHTHNPKPGLMGRIAARLAGVPVVVNTVHGYWATPDDPPRRRWPVMALERVGGLFSDAELFQSAEDMVWAKRAHLAPVDRLHHLGNGTDLAAFDADAVDPARLSQLRAELGIPPEGLVVGMIGRLVREKGYGEFFRVARDVRRHRPDVTFLAIGPFDTDKDDAISQSERRAASTDVVFAGYRSDVRDLLALMDVFVLPSWREGMPRSAIEAAAMGRAMVLTNIRGCREVARDQREAILVPPRDHRALGVAVERLLADPGLRSRLGTAARERARSTFDEGEVASRVLETYRSLLPHAAPGRRVELEGLRDVVIRPARRRDVPAMAALHAQVMTKAFLPQLGEGFLRHLFTALVDDPDSPTLVADQNGAVIGYTSGVVSMRAFRRRFVVRRGVPAAFAAAPRLVRPRVLKQAAELFAYPEQTAGLPEAEHTLIGVRPRTAPGLGLALTREALSALCDRGVREIKCYVAADNKTMQRVLWRMGFERRGDITVHDGVPSMVCVYRCPGS